MGIISRSLATALAVAVFSAAGCADERAPAPGPASHPSPPLPPLKPDQAGAEGAAFTLSIPNAGYS